MASCGRSSFSEWSDVELQSVQSLGGATIGDSGLAVKTCCPMTPMHPLGRVSLVSSVSVFWNFFLPQLMATFWGPAGLISRLPVGRGTIRVSFDVTSL